jgi:hypothetical protein
MKDRTPSNLNERLTFVVQLPPDDHRVYTEARRILRCLMGRRTPRIETLLLHDLSGRDATGVVDNYLDAIRWPLERGRAITVQLREQARRQEGATRNPRRANPRLGKPPADPARN